MTFIHGCAMCENGTRIYECTTDETTEIFEESCLDIEVTVSLKGWRLQFGN